MKTVHIFCEADRIRYIRELEKELEIPHIDLELIDTQSYLDWLRDALHPRNYDEGQYL
jgi:hypothetical protein